VANTLAFATYFECDQRMLRKTLKYTNLVAQGLMQRAALSHWHLYPSVAAVFRDMQKQTKGSFFIVL
jgi:hypothetical protein